MELTKFNMFLKGFRHLLIACGAEPLMGWIDFYRFPERRNSWGGALNGQEGRKRIVAQIVAEAPISAIVETGTYRGTTTALFAETSLPVFSIEGHPRNFGFARARLARYANVHLYLGDSREQLRKLILRKLSVFKSDVILFYLDAHWDADLPLSEELLIIFENFSNAIVMVDDFQVPDDAGYHYDDYGSGKALTFAYIEPVVMRFDIIAFYPALGSVAETGMKRGSVVLSKRGRADVFLQKVQSLRQL